MREFENVRQVLEKLEAINNPKSDIIRKYGTGINETARLVDAKELQKLNYEDIASLCDLLGMNDIYRGGTKND